MEGLPRIKPIQNRSSGAGEMNAPLGLPLCCNIFSAYSKKGEPLINVIIIVLHLLEISIFV